MTVEGLHCALRVAGMVVDGTFEAVGTGHGGREALGWRGKDGRVPGCGWTEW